MPRLPQLVPAIGAGLLVAMRCGQLSVRPIFGQSGLSLLYLTLYFVCLSAAWNLFSGFSGYINFGFVGLHRRRDVRDGDRHR